MENKSLDIELNKIKDDINTEYQKNLDSFERISKDCKFITNLIMSIYPDTLRNLEFTDKKDMYIRFRNKDKICEIRLFHDFGINFYIFSFLKSFKTIQIGFNDIEELEKYILSNFKNDFKLMECE